MTVCLISSKKIGSNTFRIMTFIIMTFSVMTFSIMTFSITTLSIVWHYAEFCYAQCYDYLNVMPSDVIA
jgi:hypothetical protein